MKTETEVKIQVDQNRFEACRQRLRRDPAWLCRSRTKEVNLVMDFPDRLLAARGCLLRIRQWGPETTLTYKGRSLDNPVFKQRPELETQLGDSETAEKILLALGLRRSFIYEKLREKYRFPVDNEQLEISLDETPFGLFVEIEGAQSAIGNAVKELGLTLADSVTKSYVDLYREHGLGECPVIETI